MMKSNRVPEYLFSISDTSENDIKITHPNTSPICVTSASGNNFQSLLPSSAELSISTLRTTFPYGISSKKLLPLDVFIKISHVPKLPRKYSITNKELCFFLHKQLTNSRRSKRGEEEIKPNSTEIEIIKSPNNTSG